jgi:hypothetical protein
MLRLAQDAIPGRGGSELQVGVEYGDASFFEDFGDLGVYFGQICHDNVFESLYDFFGSLPFTQFMPYLLV